jgi:exonuclease SbcD
MKVKFIHAADIHLDSPFLGLERYEGAPVEYVRSATRVAFQNLVNLALEEKVDLVLLAGDLYDGDWRDYNTGLFFASQVAKLREAGIKVFLVRGNHDAASQITHVLRLPDNVKVLSTHQPESAVLEDLGVVIHGQSFHTPAVTEDLSRGYPLPRKGYFNIGLLHTCASGREGHESYAPCDINYLKNKGYDYWALGHVHKAEIISKEPWIVFPGNTQGRHIREEGAKGCTVAQVCDGRLESLEHHSLDVLRWSRCMIDAAGAETFEEIMQRAEKKIDEELSKCEGRLLALRVIVFGACEIHRKLVNNLHGLKNNLRSLAAERGPEAVWLEKVKVETTPKASMEDLVASYPVASLLRYIKELSKDNHFLQELTSELDRDKNALPADLFKKGEIDPADINYLQGLLPEVEAIILSRLLEKEGFSSEV